MVLTSLWLDRGREARASTPAPTPLSGHVDVVVVGGGLTGLTTALLLGRAGRSVTVLEADTIASGTTGRSTAKVSLLQGTRLSTISRLHSDTVTLEYVEANREAQAWVRRFCDDHDVAYQERPAYTYAHSTKGRSQVEKEYQACRKMGLPVELLDELPLPFPTSGAVRLGHQLQVDPVALADALAREAAAHGVRIYEDARVREVSGRAPVHVRTDGGELTADRVVVATNLPFLDRGGFFARMSPGRSYALAFRTRNQAVEGMYLSADAPSRSLRDQPTEEDGHLLLVGGNGHTTGRTRSEAERLDQLREWTHQWWPDAEETHAWSAQDYSPHHALPFAGPVLPGMGEIMVAGGYSKWGMTNAVAASLALASQILEGHILWAKAFRTWAPHEVRGLLGTLVINAEVGFHMARGWASVPLNGGAVKTESGEAALSRVCTHMGGIVQWNDAEHSWDCPLHGSRFGPDGEVLEGPATCGLRRRRG